MPLSRLENLLRSPKGNVIYVDPNSFDATDSFENRGDSLTRPFKTIQRALIEAARFSYVSGPSNDLNDRTTILVYPGVHYIDNRPGLSITNSSGTPVYKKRTGVNTWTNEVFTEFSENSNFNIFDVNNDFYKFNSTEGGVILPRGTSIVGLDLRKTKIRPLFVPDPLDDNVDRSSIFKITGNCYFTAFTFFDADPSTAVYKDYNYELTVPNFSHHKLTAFTYADGVNRVKLGLQLTDLTDLQMYYYKISNAYGNISGRGIPDYPSNTDNEPVTDEYRIVGVLEENLIGISSIRSGNGLGGGVLNEITVTTKDIASNTVAPHKLTPDTAIIVSGVTVNPTSYNGAFRVKSIVDENTFTYITPSIPANKLPSAGQFNSAVIKVESDTASSSSPYVFNCSMRSTLGMCGLWADGSKADGFKSVVVAQFTGISLQKDDNAFILYSKANKDYITNDQIPESSVDRPLHTNSLAIYKPDFENFHIRVSNNAFIQCVSIFAIGFAKHFVSESGGDMSITNSNSNFGALSLESVGFRNESFDRDDVGYITHIIPPRAIEPRETEVTWLPIDVGLTTSLVNETRKFLYLYDYNDKNQLPPYKIDGYRVGARINDELNLIIEGEEEPVKSIIMMEPNTVGGDLYSSKKEHKIVRVNGVNDITPAGIFTITDTHALKTGEKVRLISDTGQMPDGLESNLLYYVIRINATRFKLAYNFNDAIAGVAIEGLSDNGGEITVLSTVSDKIPGEPGHPIQWDNQFNNWYIISSRLNAENGIYNRLRTTTVEQFGVKTLETSFKRFPDVRNVEDKLYKVRYVIPKEYKNIRQPEIGFVLQESKSTEVTPLSVDNTEPLKIFDRRNEKVISSIVAGSIVNNSQLVTVETEAPHNFEEGDIALIQKVKSTFNPNAVGLTSSFNGSYEIVEILDSHKFKYRISGISTNPGVFTNDIQTRNSLTVSDLPIVSREQYNNTFVVYRVNTVKSHIPGGNGQDGIYHLTLISSNIKTDPSIGFGLANKEYNQDVRTLYPQTDRDNFTEDAKSSVSFADSRILGKVITNDKRNSITKEALNYFIQNNNIGFGITNLTLSGVGNTTITIQTDVEHKLNSIKQITITSGGSGQSGYYYGQVITIGGNPTDARCNYDTVGGEIDPDTIDIIDGGSRFNVNQVIGIGTLGATATVAQINSNLQDGLQLSGFKQSEFNDVFQISSVTDSKTIVLVSSKSLPAYQENTNNRIPFGFLSSEGVGITSISFTDVENGVVTVKTSTSHGLFEGNNFKIVGSGVTVYDSTFRVQSTVGLSTFTFVIKDAETNPIVTQGVLFKKVLSPNSKSTGKTGENLGNRLNFIYSGTSTSRIDAMSSSDTTLTFKDEYSGFRRGDFIQINSEILRITKSNDNVYQEFEVQRGLFGTSTQEIPEFSRVYKIKVLPVELRRPSFMRASGHTFEYLGYGPGNYSTAIPQKQTRKLNDDEVLNSQARKISGGSVVYSGMNDLGEFYFGGKKVSSITGEEIPVETPIISFFGDDLDGTDDSNKSSGFFDSLLVRQKLTVEGGDDGNDTSVFYGPVKFEKGLSINDNLTISSLTLKTRSVDKKVSLLKPTTNISNGDIYFSGISSVFMGEIYLPNSTGGSDWRRWGLISRTPGIWDVSLDNISVKTLDVTETLTINGVTFSSGGIQSLNLGSLFVSGISTFRGEVYGGLNDTLRIRDSVLIGTPGTGNTSTIISNTGRTISIGATSLSNYSLRITRDEPLANSNSKILHKGSGALQIIAEDANGEVSLSRASGGTSGITTLTVGSDGIVTISKNHGGLAGQGAHLSLLNTSNAGNADAILSWRSGISSSFWFAGIDATDNGWKLAYSTPDTLPTSVNFSGTVASSITTNRLIITPDGGVNVTGFLTGAAVRTSIQKISEGNSSDLKIPTEKAIVDYCVDTFAQKPPQGSNSFIVLHVSKPGIGVTLAGSASVPAGYDPVGVGYTLTPTEDDFNLRPFTTKIFSTVTDALNEAQNTPVPIGAEIIISIHNNLNNQRERGPIMISNSWTPIIIAGARGATETPAVRLETGFTLRANTRFPQFDFNILSAGAIFQDLDINVDVSVGTVWCLTFNGGFGVNARNTNINWLNCSNGQTLINATASYGEKIQFRTSMDATPINPALNGEDDRKLTTNAYFISGQDGTNTIVSMMDSRGGLAGQGVDLIFDFKDTGYGIISAGNAQRNNTLVLRFYHNIQSNPKVKLKMLGIGSRGNCNISSRDAVAVLWDFAQVDWDMSEFYTGFHTRFNVCSISFGPVGIVTAGIGTNNYNITRATADSIKNSGGIKLENGARIWIRDDKAGPFNLYSHLSGKVIKSIEGGGDVSFDGIKLIRLNQNSSDAFIYDELDKIESFNVRAWGEVNSDGTKDNGGNFTSKKTSTGNYTITFNEPLPNNNYSVTCTLNGELNDVRLINVKNKNTTEFDVQIKQLLLDDLILQARDMTFTFIVVY